MDVQLQNIQNQLSNVCPNPIQYKNLQNQIINLQKQLNTMDKTNLALYSATLERLYNTQKLVSTSNNALITDLLSQKVQILEKITGQ